MSQNNWASRIGKSIGKAKFALALGYNAIAVPLAVAGLVWQRAINERINLFNSCRFIPGWCRPLRISLGNEV